MSAAASAEMIETPPVLNFEEIDYKEIEVEEVSGGPASPGAASRSGVCFRAARPRAACPRRAPCSEGAAALRSSRRVPVCPSGSQSLWCRAGKGVQVPGPSLIADTIARGCNVGFYFSRVCSFWASKFPERHPF